MSGLFHLRNLIMKIDVTAREFTITVKDDHDNVALDYKVENYTFSADLPALVNAAAALMYHINTMLVKP